MAGDEGVDERGKLHDPLGARAGVHPVDGKDQSFSLDLYITLKTVWVVARGSCVH